jgi:hypothetical protein
MSIIVTESETPTRRLAPDTVHVIDCTTGQCLCHTRFMYRVEKIGSLLGRRVEGVYEWQLRLARLARLFQISPRVIRRNKSLPVPGIETIEQLGIAGEISPIAVASAAEASATETFYRAHYEKVQNALKHRSHPAA